MPETCFDYSLMTLVYIIIKVKLYTREYTFSICLKYVWLMDK